MKKLKNHLFSTFVMMLIAALTISFTIPADFVYAKSRSRSYSSGGFKTKSYSPPKFSNRKSGSSLFKKSTPKKTKVSTQVASRGTGNNKQATPKKGAWKKSSGIKAGNTPAPSFSKHSTKRKTQRPAKLPGGSSLDKKVNTKTARARSTQAKNNYNKQQSQFKGNPAPKTDYKNKKTQDNLKGTYDRIGYSEPSTYHSRRQGFYSGSNYRTDSYRMGRHSPSYGIYDTVALMYAFDHIDNPAYAMMFMGGNPGALLFLAAMGKNDSEKEKIKQLEAKVAKMEKDGVKVQPGYVPPEMGDLMLSQEAVEQMDKQNVARMTIATAGKDGNFFQFGNMLKASGRKNGNLEVKVGTSKGSMQNLDLFASGKVDAIMVSAAAVAKWLFDNPGKEIKGAMGTAYYEYGHLLVNKKFKGSSIKDLNPKKGHYSIFGKGSGMEGDWWTFANEEEDFAAFLSKDTVIKKNGSGKPTLMGGGHYKNLRDSGALGRVVDDKNGAMLFMAGLNSKLLKKAMKFSKDLKLIHVNDGDFNDGTIKDRYGNAIYEFAKVPGSIYGELQPQFFGANVSFKTVKAPCYIILSDKWVEKHGQKGLNAFDDAVLMAKGGIKKVLGKEY